MLTKFRRRTDEYSEINKKMGNMRKYQKDITELKNTITVLNRHTHTHTHTHEGFNNN